MAVAGAICNPDSILILDRGFASQNIISFLLSKELKFVVRLRHGTSIVAGDIEPGKMEIYENALYRGKLKVHIVGYRPCGLL